MLAGGLSLTLAPAAAFSQGTRRRTDGALRRSNSFPVYRQPDGISCGPTCCSMVLKYYGVSAGVEPLKTVAKTQWFAAGKERVGLSVPSGLRDAMNRYGVGSVVGVMKRGGLDSVMTMIDDDRPPILLVRSGVKTWHYIVAVAYRKGGAEFKVADPSGSSYWISRTNLDRGWTFSGDYSSGKTIEGRRCRICGGAGKVAKASTKCPTCFGKGKTVFGKCRVCAGSGNIGTKGVFCVACDGDGRETDFFRKAVESAGVTGKTLIVPKLSPNGKKPTGDSPKQDDQWVNYTIRNDSGRTIAVTMKPSGKSYKFAPGYFGKFKSRIENGRRPTIQVQQNGKNYGLVDGEFVFWYSKADNSVKFSRRPAKSGKQ